MLSIYTLKESKQWDRVVKTFSNYDVYWLSGYVKAFQIHGDGEPLLFYYEANTTRGINVVMKRDIALDRHFKNKLPLGKYFDFSTPYGYGGWLIEGDDKRKLFDEYEKWCQSNNIISEFVRFHPIVKNHKGIEKYYEINSLGNTIAMKLDSAETIWNNITSKNRNMIRKAEKSGVEIFCGHSEKLYEEFANIYNETMDYDNAEEYYYFEPEFYNSICYDLAENAQVFYATKDDKMIAASIVIAANGKLNYHLSGSKYEYRSLAPSNLLLYKVALWGCANGYTSFHLGGGVGAREDNLFKFKRAFYRCDDLCKFNIGKKIFMEDRYTQLMSMRETINSTYFPKYRA